MKTQISYTHTKYGKWGIAIILILSIGFPITGLTIPPSNPSQFDVTGTIQSATLDPTCSTNVTCGGTIVVNNQLIIVPKNTILQMPATAITWQQLYTKAPSPYGPTQTGLALSDNPSPRVTFEAHIVGNRNNDQYIAGLIFLSQSSLQSGQGFINFINYTTGELQVGGTIGDSATGERVKINDPIGRFGRIWTPDSRFTIDEDNPTIRSETGYPMCIPRAAPGVPETDTLCPQTNRPLDAASPSGFAMIFTMPALVNVNINTPNPSVMTPFEIGDYVSYSGILLNNGANDYIAAYQVIANVGLFTTPGTDPAYVATDVMLLGVGGITVAGGIEATARTRFEGFTTDPSRNILLYAVDVDPCTGANLNSLRSWGSMNVDQGPPTGAVRGRWRFRPPSTVLTSPPAGTFLPATREMIAALETSPGSGIPSIPFVTLNNLSAGKYQAPIFEFLFPENANVGTPIVPNNFEDMPFLAFGSGPLNGVGTIVSQLDPWPLGFTVAPTPKNCTISTVTANAGAVQTVISGAAVTLAGSAIDTANAPPFTFTWTQATSDTVKVVLTQNTSTGVATFTAPTINFGQAAVVLHFSLIATNNNGVTSAPSNTTVTVNPVAADVVGISLVEYRTTKLRLTINASSSAPTAILTATMFDGSGVAQGSATMTLAGGIYTAVFVGVAQPATVKVTSDHGGIASSPITKLRT